MPAENLTAVLDVPARVASQSRARDLSLGEGWRFGDTGLLRPWRAESEGEPLLVQVPRRETGLEHRGAHLCQIITSIKRSTVRACETPR